MLRPLKIMNIMLGEKLGGIEHVFLDYTQALEMAGFETLSVVHPKAQVRKHVLGKVFELSNWNAFDIFAAWRLRGAIKRYGIDLIITHGNRAFSLAHMARGSVPLLAVSHNYKYQKLYKASAILAITKAMAGEIKSKNPQHPPVYTLYNPIILESDMVLVPKVQLRDIPILGFMGRLVPKKGCHVFLESLALLKKAGFPFRALIAGQGPEETRLHQLTQELGLGEDVKFLGWVGDRSKFFDQIDLFVVPSSSEPFGVVILEAWKYGKPLLATQVGGPAELVEHGVTGLLVEPENPEVLQKGILDALSDSDRLGRMAAAGQRRVEAFGLEPFSNNLKAIVDQVLGVFKP